MGKDGKCVKHTCILAADVQQLMVQQCNGQVHSVQAVGLRARVLGHEHHCGPELEAEQEHRHIEQRLLPCMIEYRTTPISAAMSQKTVDPFMLHHGTPGLKDSMSSVSISRH